MPDGTGYSLMRQLLDAGRKLHGIAISGYGSAEDVQRSLAAGFAARTLHADRVEQRARRASRASSPTPSASA